MAETITALNQTGLHLANLLRPLSLEWALWSALVLGLAYSLMRHTPFLRHLAWVLVLVKPGTALIAHSPLAGYLPQLAALWTIPEEAVHFDPRHPQEMLQPLAPPALPSEPLPAAGLDLYGWLTLAWGIGVVVLALRLGSGFVALAGVRRRAAAIKDGPLYRLLRETAAQVGLRRRVDLGFSDEVPGPLLAGFWRPTVLLPPRLADALDPEQLRLVLAHELTHARRFDNAVLLGQRLVELFFFFHPAAWLCRYHLRRCAEQACDAAVLRRFPDPARYADSLARVAELRLAGRHQPLISTFAGRPQLNRRVRLILSGRIAQRRTLTTVCAAALLFTAGCIGLPGFLGGKKTAESDVSEDRETHKIHLVVELPEEEHAKLEIFDLKGMRVLTLLDSIAAKGRTLRRWTGVDSSGALVDKGVYFVRLQAGEGMQMRKVVLGETAADTTIVIRPGLLKGAPPIRSTGGRTAHETFVVDKDGSRDPATADTVMLPMMLNGKLHSRDLPDLDTLVYTYADGEVTVRKVVKTSPGARVHLALDDTLLVHADGQIHVDEDVFVFKTAQPADSVRVHVEVDDSEDGIPRRSVRRLYRILSNDSSMVRDTVLVKEEDLVFRMAEPADSVRVVFHAMADTREPRAGPPISATDLSISYEVDIESKVKITVFDHKGNAVDTLVDALQPPGAHTLKWDAEDNDGRRVEPGVYFYRLEIGTHLKRMARRVVE